ncbi:MAG TPA: hypothetical protein DCG32_08730 [Sphaerochaeta sp.]|jgi:rhamnosyl/mannosyltransferase|nr:hypothetical protein [Sphaerochaeta sp.]
MQDNGKEGETMRILQVSKLYPPKIGGVERIVQQIAEGLNDKTDMQVLVCQEKGRGCDEVYGGVKVRRSGSLGIFLSMPLSFSFLHDLRRLSKDADIIHFHMPFPLGDLAYFFSGYKGKIVIWWHMEIVRQKKAMAIYRPMMMKFLERADLIMVATEGHVKGSEVLQQFKDKIVVIPFGLDDAFLEKSLAAIGKGNTAATTSAATNFLFIGRLVYYKGCDVLLEAFAKMGNKEAHLTLVGGGPMKEELETVATSYGIKDRVHMLGSIPYENLLQHIADCDVFVLPSSERTEAFGIVQIEAMAYGKPVINTNLPTGVPYVSLHGKTGLTVEPKDVKGLTEAMDRLANDADLRQKFGKSARKRVEDEYRLSSILDRIYAQYEKVLEK